MAKTKKEGNKSSKLSFEEKLERLEELGDEIRKNDVDLDDAIKAFEEGIRLARELEKELEKIESRIEILMSGSSAGSEGAAGTAPELSLFDDEQ